MTNRITRKSLPSYPPRHNTRERKLYETIKDDKNIKDIFSSACVVSSTNNVDGSQLTGASAEVAGFSTSEANYEVYFAATSSNATAAVAAVYSLECRADSADDLDGTWFALATPGGWQVFWYDTDDSGTTQPDSGLPDATYHEIAGVATNDTAATVATVTEAIIEAAGFSSSVDTATITITADQAGYTQGINAGDAAHTALSVTTEGENEIEGVFKAPYQSTDGLELAITSTGDAIEITNGRSSLSQAAWTVGSAPFYLKATILIDDISDVTEIFAGFRKAEAYQADPDSYDEMASFNIGKDADGQVEIHTILNNGSTTETDTTETDWDDEESHTIEIRVAKDGSCKFFYDGAEPTVTQAFSFDAGEVVVPFLHLNTETGDPGVSISLWEVGALEDA